MPWQEDTILPATVSRQDEQVSGLKRSESKIRKKPARGQQKYLILYILTSPKQELTSLMGDKKFTFKDNRQILV